MSTEQPDALLLAEELEEPLPDYPAPSDVEARAAEELRRLHAENESLKVQLEAVGAGGVGPMMAAPAQAAPENIREGAPYNCPEFEDMARRMKVWGTAGSALCAQFWLGGMRARSTDAS